MNVRGAKRIKIQEKEEFLYYNLFTTNYINENNRRIIITAHWLCLSFYRPTIASDSVSLCYMFC